MVEGFINVVTSSLCFESSIAIRSGFMSKLIQDIRFLNINYSPRMIGIFQTHTSFFLAATIPSNIQQNIISNPLSSIYSQYSIKRDFLSNIWGRLVAWMSILATWIICRLPALCDKGRDMNASNIILKLLKTVSQSILSFLIVQVYSDINSIVLFTVLEIKCVTFRSPWSVVSFVCSILFLLTGLFLLGLHFWFLVTYHKLKSRHSATSPEIVNTFTKKFEALNVLYKDFSDLSILRHGFLLIQAIRSVVVSLILTTMLSYPMLEASLLVCSSVCMCLYMLFQNPFSSCFAAISQFFLEACVFAVYLSVLLLAIFEYQGNHQLQQVAVDQSQIEQTIIVVNLILKYGCIVLMSIDTISILWKVYQDRKKRKIHTTADSSQRDESSPSQVHIKPAMDESFANSRLSQVDIKMMDLSLAEKSRSNLSSLGLKGHNYKISNLIFQRSIRPSSEISDLNNCKREGSASGGFCENYPSQSNKMVKHTQSDSINKMEGQSKPQRLAMFLPKQNPFLKPSPDKYTLKGLEPSPKRRITEDRTKLI